MWKGTGVSQNKRHSWSDWMEKKQIHGQTIRTAGADFKSAGEGILSLLVLPPQNLTLDFMKSRLVLKWASLVAQMVKASAYHVGDLGSIPGLGRSSGEGKGNPLQYSCLENPMSRGALRATVHGIARVGYNLETKSPPPTLDNGC